MLNRMYFEGPLSWMTLNLFQNNSETVKCKAYQMMKMVWDVEIASLY